MKNVAVAGALGNMGIETCKSVMKDTELALAGVVDVASCGAEVGGLEVVESVGMLEAGSVDILVDFTVAAAAVENIMWAMENGVHAVVGTTGISDDDLVMIKKKAGSVESNVLVAPNFALGAVLMMRFAEMAASVFDECEIIELHHRGKVDAPSGTALVTATRVARSMDSEHGEPEREQGINVARGVGIGPVQIHSVRLDGLIAHQEVLFGSPGQTLSIRHDSVDRSCFMPGVIMAIKAIDSLPGLTIGLEKVLLI